MEDKYLMESLLMSIKGVIDLYMHGSIESSHDDVRLAFNKAINESLHMQNEIYQLMANKGWYPTENETVDKINKVKQKFAI